MSEFMFMNMYYAVLIGLCFCSTVCACVYIDYHKNSNTVRGKLVLAHQPANRDSCTTSSNCGGGEICSSSVLAALVVVVVRKVTVVTRYGGLDMDSDSGDNWECGAGWGPCECVVTSYLGCGCNSRSSGGGGSGRDKAEWW